MISLQKSGSVIRSNGHSWLLRYLISEIKLPSLFMTVLSAVILSTQSGCNAIQGTCQGEMCQVLGLDKVSYFSSFSSGVGVVIQPGIILTADHVTDQCKEVKVLLPGETSAKHAENHLDDYRFGPHVRLLTFDNASSVELATSPSAVAKSSDEVSQAFLKHYKVETIKPISAENGSGNYDFNSNISEIHLLLLLNISSNTSETFNATMFVVDAIDMVSFVSHGKVIWKGENADIGDRSMPQFNSFFASGKKWYPRPGQSGSPIYDEDGQLFAILIGGPTSADRSGLVAISPLIRSIALVPKAPNFRETNTDNSNFDSNTPQFHYAPLARVYCLL